MRPVCSRLLPSSDHGLSIPTLVWDRSRKLTFGGQSTYILKVEGKKDAFIFMADIWRPEHPSDARYIWLPVQFKEGVPYVEWMDNWTLDFFQ